MACTVDLRDLPTSTIVYPRAHRRNIQVLLSLQLTLANDTKGDGRGDLG